MKILHLIKTSSGATWAVRQVRELVRHGLEVHVAVPPGPRIQEYETAGAVPHILETAVHPANGLKTMAAIKNIRDLVNAVRPDIIHSHFVANALAARLALGNSHHIPRIFQVPGPLHLEHRIFRNVDLWSAGTADNWIASCQWTRKAYIASGISPTRVGLVYYGIDLPDSEPVRTNAFRREIGIGEDEPLVGNVSFFYPPKRYLGQKVGLKGHEDLFAAVDIAAKSVRGLVCAVVGEAWGGADWYSEKLKRVAENASHARIVMVGFRSDVFELYPDFDVAVHPSHSENLGGAVESLANCVPTIATNVGGFPDVVHDGRTGLLVPPRSPAELAAAIVTVFANLDRARMIARVGRERVVELLDVRRNAAELVGYYENLLRTGCLTPVPLDVQ